MTPPLASGGCAVRPASTRADAGTPRSQTKRCRLSASDRAAGRLRAWVATQLAGWGLEHLRDDLTLIAAELAANAVRHAGSAADVRLTLRSGGPRGPYVRLEVVDAGPGFDVAAVTATWQDEEMLLGCRGRGLLLVAGVSSRWGCGRIARGHRVWAEVACTA
ncbi:ATP-binding protein [Streptomyces sp. NPDC051976]|uniref:ATP-binding protein n=1 Tax=Streptomyces sp. NPDC051976 TaxID=3154947 RepID=UPI0034386CE1